MRSLIAAGMVVTTTIGTLATSTTENTAYERWLRVHNETSYDLCYVYISHVGTRRWDLTPWVTPA